MLRQSGNMSFRTVFCLLGIILAAALVMSGCATTDTIKQPAEQEGMTARGQEAAPEGNLITDISIEENAEAIIVSIMANHVLDYTLAEPPLQQAKVLYFPDSALDLRINEFPLDNELIGTIEAVELVKGGPSKIVIPIKSPGLACEAHRGDNDTTLRLVFPRIAVWQTAEADVVMESAAVEEVAAPVEEVEEEEEEEVWSAPDETATPFVEEEPVQYKPAMPATRLENVDVLAEDGLVTIKIKADGTIKTHKSFTLKGPPRIVLDLAGLTSPYKKEQRLAVESNMVQQIRHCGHQGYLRVVLDVDQEYLSSFKAAAVDDGLMIYVGNTAALARVLIAQEEMLGAVEETAAAETSDNITEEAIESEQPPTEPIAEVAAKAPATAPEEDVAIGTYSRPALVNEIDFIDEYGRSTVRIGTTHPVKYALDRTGANKLRLTLEGADILSFRQRPLITTRFDSAVNSIIPLQTQAMKEKGMSVVDINLREEVGYVTERTGNFVLVHFEPSSVPPDPAQQVVIPADYAILTEETKEPAPADMAEEPAEEEMTTAAPLLMPYETDVVLVPDVPAQPEPSAPLLPGKKKAYTGEPIALEFYKTDIRNVIQILKDVSGKNFAIDEGVKGSVTLSFVQPVPWDQVLDLVLEMNNLGMVEWNGIVRISTQETILKQKEAARAAMAAEQELKVTEEQLAPLVTEYFSISYSDPAADIMPHIEDILTKERGHAKVDIRTKQVIMTDIQEKIDKAREIIEKIDRVTPQVMISARIVETSTNFSREFGTEWGINNSPGTYRGEVGGTYNYDVAMNNAAPATNILGVNFSRIAGTPFSLDAKLSLMESEGEVRIISSPRIVTIDSKKATIAQGQEIPYRTYQQGGASPETEFKDAELKLEVTPHVTPDNRVRMEIHIEEKEVGEKGEHDEPPLNTKKATTELLVNDGDTIVIGGIIQQTEKRGQSGIPFLSKIPVLGHLFKKQSKSNDKTELLIFITPTIVRLD